MSKLGSSIVTEALRKSAEDIDALLAGTKVPEVEVEEEVEEDIPPAVAKSPAPENHVWLSDLLGDVHTGMDVLVPTYFHLGLEIPALDPNYLPHPKSSKMIRKIVQGKPILFTGPPGTGKTEWCKWFAAKTGRPYIGFDMNENIDPTMLTGQKGISKGETVFHEGDLPLAMAKPTVILFDEASRISAAMGLAVYQPLLNHRMLRCEDQEVGDKRRFMHPDAILILADNTKMLGDTQGKYATANTQDTSTVNRLRGCFEFDYPTVDKMQALINSWAPSLPNKLARQLALFAELCQQGYKNGSLSLSFSLRQLKDVAEDTEKSRDLYDEIMDGYANFFDGSERGQVMTHLKTVGIKEI